MHFDALSLWDVKLINYVRIFGATSALENEKKAFPLKPSREWFRRSDTIPLRLEMEIELERRYLMLSLRITEIKSTQITTRRNAVEAKLIIYDGERRQQMKISAEKWQQIKKGKGQRLDVGNLFVSQKDVCPLQRLHQLNFIPKNKKRFLKDFLGRHIQCCSRLTGW